MRLIDADALEHKVLEWMPPNPCGREEKEYPFETDIVASLMMEIEEAPTIDADRPQGEWIPNTNGDECKYICSKCLGGSTFTWNFCPKCGANMRGDKE